MSDPIGRGRKAEHKAESEGQLEIPSGAAGELSAEVGHEGGTPGDVELQVDSEPDTGSEATELIDRRGRKNDEIRRDETGVGRRSPIG